MNLDKNNKLLKLILLLEFISISFFIYGENIMPTEKVLALIITIFLNCILFISTTDNIFAELLGFEEECDYYQAYLNLVIDNLRVANTSIDKLDEFRLSPNDKDECILAIEGCLNYLETIQPPCKYKNYHNDILFNLKNVLEESK